MNDQLFSTNSMLSSDIDKKSLNSSSVDKYRDKLQCFRGIDLGKSKSQSTPSSPLNAHNCNIHALDSRYSNTPSFKDRKQSLRYSTSILNRSGSVDTMSPISSELSSEAQNKGCDTVQEAAPLECAEDEDKKEEGEIDEIEEMDEDLLYLRLMALRSIDLRGEGPKENKFAANAKTFKNTGNQKEIQCIDVEDMVDEMEDLLNEADQAASEEAGL